MRSIIGARHLLLPGATICRSSSFTGATRGGGRRTIRTWSGEGGGHKTQAWGVPAITVDGNDAVAVYRVASESIARARLGRGPTLIECGVYPLHGPAGNHRKNGRRLEAHDPISAMEIHLARKGLFSERLKRQTVAGFRRELDAATRFLEN